MWFLLLAQTNTFLSGALSKVSNSGQTCFVYQIKANFETCMTHLQAMVDAGHRGR